MPIVHVGTVHVAAPEFHSVNLSHEQIKAFCEAAQAHMHDNPICLECAKTGGSRKATHWQLVAGFDESWRGLP
jgi:rhodanese-related sulfurtransferase